eukprot:UN23572
MDDFGITSESYDILEKYIANTEDFSSKRKWTSVGRGAFGQVYLTERKGDEVAVKIARNTGDIKNQIIEAKMLEKCNNCSHVCRFLNVVFDDKDKSMWLVMQYYEHGSLKQYLTKQKQKISKYHKNENTTLFDKV